MSGNVRVGIVGATVTVGGSGFGAQAHVPAIHAAPGVELKAVCTSREDTARASAEAFGAELAFHDVHAMASHPEVDLVVVCVRVPWHRELVMAGLAADRPVFCEWPLGADLREAQQMSAEARARALPTMVGLQGRSDATLRYARDLVAEGYVGEVLVANVSALVPAVLERGPGRLWQADRANGANPLTIAGGHTLDALCFLLGELATVAARVTTQVPQWRHAETGEQVPVTAPDTVGIVGRLVEGVEVAAQVAAVPSNASGTRIQIHGREGSLLLTAPLAQIGPHRLLGGRGSEPLAELEPPERYTLVPDRGLADRARNVAEAYARIAAALGAGDSFSPDFELAVERHRLLDAIERSCDDGRTIGLQPRQ